MQSMVQQGLLRYQEFDRDRNSVGQEFGRTGYGLGLGE